jgi:hypothetical protein
MGEYSQIQNLFIAYYVTGIKLKVLSASFELHSWSEVLYWRSECTYLFVMLNIRLYIDTMILSCVGET